MDASQVTVILKYNTPVSLNELSRKQVISQNVNKGGSVIVREQTLAANEVFDQSFIKVYSIRCPPNVLCPLGAVNSRASMNVLTEARGCDTIKSYVLPELKQRYS